MAEPIGALYAVLSASSARFAADMGKAREALSTNAAKMSRAMDKVKSSFGAVLKSAKTFGAYALAAGGAAFVALIKKSIDTADQIGKMSQKIGVSVEQLSTLAYAAELSGVELATLQMGLRTVAKQAQDMSAGTGEARYAFQALGISVKKNEGGLKSADELLKDVADQFKNMEDGATKSALAMRIFGDAGSELIPLLNLGRDGIEQLQQKAAELGLKLNTETVLAAAEFNDRLTMLKAVVTGFGRTIVTDALPALNQMITAMAEAYAKGDGFFGVLWEGIRSIGELERAEKRLAELLEIRRQKENGTFLEKLNHINILTPLLDKEIKKAQEEVAQAKAAQEARDAEAKAAADRYQQEIENERILTELRIANTKKVAEAYAKAQKVEAEQLRQEQEKKAAEEREKQRLIDRQKAIEETIADYQREIDLWDVKTRRGKVAYEIEKGNLTDLTAAQQAKLLSLADELDILDALQKQTEKYANTQEEMARMYRDDMVRAIETFGERSTDVLTDFALSGKLSFKSLADSIIRDLIRIQIQMNLTRPLFDRLALDFLGSQATVGSRIGGGGIMETTTGGGVALRKPILPLGNRAIAGAGARAIRPPAEGPAGKMVAAQNLRIINVVDPDLINSWANSPQGERVILNTIARNPSQIKRMVN